VLSGLVDCTRLYTDDALAVPAAGDGAPAPSAYVSYADGRRETVCGDDLQVTALIGWLLGPCGWLVGPRGCGIACTATQSPLAACHTRSWAAGAASSTCWRRCAA
jgi:hypothetical protein